MIGAIDSKRDFLRNATVVESIFIRNILLIGYPTLKEPRKNGALLIKFFNSWGSINHYDPSIIYTLPYLINLSETKYLLFL